MKVECLKCGEQYFVECQSPRVADLASEDRLCYLCDMDKSSPLHAVEKTIFQPD